MKWDLCVMEYPFVLKTQFLVTAPNIYLVKVTVQPSVNQAFNNGTLFD